MSRILCVAVVMSGALLTWAAPALAGMSEGVAAVTVGDYPKAISEFQPLAASGDPAAQYQLAKIYLEGHGPVDGVPQGIDLMTKAANGNYPEAQAQLGLMYAMGLGVPVDNVKAYDWLSKAVTALPGGTRRTVAEANRDAVLKRMNASQQNAVAAASSKPAVTEEAAAKPAADATAKTKTSTSAATAAKPAVTETAAKPATTSAATTTTKPAATTSTTPTTTAKPAGGDTAAKASDSTTKVASAQAPEAAPASADPTAKPSGVRIQLVSMPSEAAAWDAWKQLSGKYSAQLTGLTAMVESADLGTKGTFYRVQTGPFETVAAAQERCTAMKEAGLDCLVVGKP
jgi:cell division septation protein DedD